MLPLAFLGQNLHFAISLFASLVCFAVFWLYFDAWAAKRQRKEIFLWLGFFLLSVSFLSHATTIEDGILGSSILGSFSEIFSTLFRSLGYLLIIFGLAQDPLQKVPQTEGLVLEKKRALFFLSKITWLSWLKFLPPFGAALVSVLYFRRATTGLERHLKRVALSFLGLTLAETLSLVSLFRGSDNPFIFNLSSSFGPVWYLEHLVLFVSVLILGKWVWQYLTTRLQSQLFMIFTSSVLLIFLTTTVSFTFLLLGNIQKEALDNLGTATNVLNYALSSKREETLANAESLAANPEVVAALQEKNHKKLNTITQEQLEVKAKASIIITENSGQVLSRGEDPARWGDSLSDDSLIKRALIGLSATSVETKEDVLAPLIYLKSAVSVRDSQKNIIGTVSIAIVIDNSFLDGIKAATGLDSAIYAGNVRSATTFVAPDGKSRWVGIKETSQEIKSKVLERGNTFKGSVKVLNKAFLGAYSPLKDVNNEVVGMLFIGRAESSILAAAGASIELTFAVAALLLAFSILPAFLISRFLSKQLS
ncbi:MAG: cache domain-containing protein [bacterium]|nr:cache domain-containing protein [bacterium]